MKALWISLIMLLLIAGASADEETDAAFAAVWAETGLDHVAVHSGGRVKSLATFARDQLHEISPHRFRKDDDPITLTLRLIGAPAEIADRHLIPVEGDVLLPLLQAAGIPVENRSLRLSDCVRIDPNSGLIVGEGPAMGVAREAALSSEEGSTMYTAGIRLLTRIGTLIDLSASLRVIPHEHDPLGDWDNWSQDPQTATALRTIFSAIRANDPNAARPAAEALTATLSAMPNYPSSFRLNVDHIYTTRRPYFWASFAYVVSGLLFFISMVTKGNRSWWAAIAVMTLGLIIHVFGAAARGYLLGRMPLSNLYESTTTGIVFIILFALILEFVYRMRVVGAISALLSFIYYRWILSSDLYGNDAISPLRAVLNSYWLDYHVTCMMLSYGAFTVAFGMGVLYLLRAHVGKGFGWTPSLEALDLYIYRAIQLGWPLLGIGIVLGAVWADTAWGRMWSWDPKETWSLITWLIYTAYLHVRLIHGWKGRVMAWVSIGGYAAVMFTYLGVNFILSGLHSYAGG